MSLSRAGRRKGIGRTTRRMRQIRRVSSDSRIKDMERKQTTRLLCSCLDPGSAPGDRALRLAVTLWFPRGCRHSLRRP
eukprot:8853403-Prorocentrum_lima.AAC.1